MIVDNGKYYVYRHLQADTGTPFYIGVGKKEGNTLDRMYRRANSTKYRNNFWNNIVNKHGFISEILVESDDDNFIKKKEVEFISLYGRKDLGSGLLCNLTSGGDVNFSRSKASIALQLETAKNNGSLKVAIDRVKKYRFNSGEATRNKPVSLYSIDGIYINTFDSMYKCSLHIGCSIASINLCLKNKKHYGIFLISELRVQKLDTTKYVLSSGKERKVCMVNPADLSIVCEYSSIIEAERLSKINERNISRSLKLRCKTKGYFWVYKEDSMKALFIKNKKISWQ